MATWRVTIIFGDALIPEATVDPQSLGSFPSHSVDFIGVDAEDDARDYLENILENGLLITPDGQEKFFPAHTVTRTIIGEVTEE